MAHTVDELFRHLVRLRRKSPIDARDEIEYRLRRDELWIDMHIASGARAHRGDWVMLPLEGWTERVHYSCWQAERVFRLRIDGERLVIEPCCSLDFRWEDYSFRITNWDRVDELWPRVDVEATPEVVPLPPADVEVLPPLANAEPLSPADVEVLPPADIEVPSPSIQWAMAMVRLLRDRKEIPEGTRKADLARLLETESQKAAKSGQIRRALKASYLENVLTPWGIWPLNSFE
jgi:hypothetical protein